MPTDQQGLELSASGEPVVELYDRAVGELMHYGPQMLLLPEQAFAEDPTCPMVNVLRIYLCLLTTEPCDVADGEQVARGLPRARSGRAPATPGACASGGRRRARAAAISSARQCCARAQPELPARSARPLRRPQPRLLHRRCPLVERPDRRGAALVVRGRPPLSAPARHARVRVRGGRRLRAGRGRRAARARARPQGRLGHPRGRPHAGDARAVRRRRPLPRRAAASTGPTTTTSGCTTGGTTRSTTSRRGTSTRSFAVYDERIFVEPALTVAVKMCDASALLWRLLLDGIDETARWRALAAVWEELRRLSVLRVQRHARGHGVRRRRRSRPGRATGLRPRAIPGRTPRRCLELLHDGAHRPAGLSRDPGVREGALRRGGRSADAHPPPPERVRRKPCAA